MKKQTKDQEAHLKDKDFKKYHKEMETRRFRSFKRYQINIDPLYLFCILIFTGSVVMMFIQALIQAFK